MSQTKAFYCPVMRNFLLSKSVFTLIVCVVSVPICSAQKFKTLAIFDGPDGDNPYSAGLVQGTDGNFYGTSADGGGRYNAGTVFKITPAGQVTTIYDFCSQPNCTDGSMPEEGVVLGRNGDFYGTTSSGGGVNGGGTIFEITPSGRLQTLYSFCSQSGCIDGYQPGAGLVQGTNENFYGTTLGGGTYDDGTIFEITAAGELTTLYNFCAGCTDGYAPEALVLATNGNFYGTTRLGISNKGTLFEITPAGKLTTLYSFCTQSSCGDGSYPTGIVQAVNGNFYGTTTSGGANSSDCFGSGCGTVFEITPAGKLTTLYSFCSQANCTDGATPDASLIQAIDGNFYGTTYLGGASVGGCNGSGCGTIFEITPAGKLTTLHSFCSKPNCADSNYPWAPIMQATDGAFFGTTTGGGIGSIFGLATGLHPFVESLPAAGKIGAAVMILGNNLTNATGVSFNGIEATFKVVSANEIRTSVPSGATTGLISVTLPGQSLKSNLPFHVIP